MLYDQFDELIHESSAHFFIKRFVNANPKDLIIYPDKVQPRCGLPPQTFGVIADFIAVELDGPPNSIS